MFSGLKEPGYRKAIQRDHHWASAVPLKTETVSN
jgi:hypothetical protein